ncbi:MAG: Hsp20/alpha crystallin family protein [Pelotomaculum sp.]|nr:Hsp20/alpha crystallin family protein [Pelotomaculum sp.]
MNFSNKDWLKFALDLYEKTRDMGFMNGIDKNGLESLIDMAGKLNFSGPWPAQPGKGGKIQQEAAPAEQEKAENEAFWQQKSHPFYGGKQPAQTKSGRNIPVSVFETAGEVSIHIVLPELASRNDLALFISPEALELSGTMVCGGTAGGDKRTENFHKTVRLPAPVDPSGAAAVYRNGTMYVRAPKKNFFSPQKIEVRFE